jgi:hypothetical protein
MNRKEYEDYEAKRAKERAILGIPENASQEEVERISRQKLLEHGFTNEKIDYGFMMAKRAANWWTEYDVMQAEGKIRRALEEERNLSKVTIDGKTYYNEDAIQPYIVESPLDLMRCENNDVPIGEAVANNGGRFFVCNLDLLDAEWL